MFGNKNSAVPYVRIGGVDRQSVLTSNANGNTPVKEIGVNANGNLIFSTDLATFKSVLDLKYSQFKSNDENQEDTWETEKSVSMRASGTLEDGTAKETGVVVSKENVAMVNASMKDNTSTASQISVSNNDATIYSTNGTSTTQITVTPTGAKVNDKEIATKSDIPSVEQNTGTSTTATMSQNAITSALSSKADTSAIPTALSQLSEDTTHRVVTDAEKATWNNKSNFDGSFTSLTNVPTASEGVSGIIQIATDQEAENGTNISKAVNPKQLQSAIQGLGTVFDLKGTKATVQDLPSSGNEIGDVWYVTAEQVGYIWLNDGATDKWEQFGAPIDLSGYVQYIDIINDLTSTATNKALSAYQGKILNDQMSSLSSQLGSTNSNVSTLQSKVSTLENDNSTNKSNISTLQTQMASQPTFSLDGTTLTITL